MSALEILFWGSVAVVLYAYAVYPLLVWSVSRLVSPPSRETEKQERRTEWPMVSLVIAAYREEDVILERLQNATLLDYPADRLEILVGCDGEEDLTGELVRSFNEPNVRLMQFPSRRGKASVLNDCIPQAQGDIIILSDANTMMDRQALRRLIPHFDDPQVGGVCGKLVLTDPRTGENVDGVYWRYENFLKRCEGRLGALLGVNGAIYAIRKELYEPIPPNTIIDDFVIGMRIHQKKKALLYEESARAYEETPAYIQDEFHRRSRIGAGGFQSLMWLWPLLNPRLGWVSWAFLSHKVLRWFCPAFLITAVAANIALSSSLFYVRVLLVHEIFYLIAAAGLWFIRGNRWQRLFRIPAMFVSMNVALLVGFFRWFRGIHGGTWKRTERTENRSVEANPPAEQGQPVTEPEEVAG